MTAQTCFTDGLHIIFSFLPLADISSSSSVCRRWSSGVSSWSESRCVRCTVRSASGLRGLADSSLARHVQTLDLTQDEMSLLMVDDLPELICRRLPHLTHLICRVDLQRLEQLQFPVGLRTLEVQIARPKAINHGWHGFSVLLTCAARVPLAKLHITALWNPVSMPSADAMEPLRLLRDTITELEFTRPPSSSGAQWTVDHYALFRSLSRLTRLDVSRGWWSHRELEPLVARGVAERLRIRSPRTLHLISRLPSLTELDVSLHESESDHESIDLAVLGRVTQLATLHLELMVRRNLDTRHMITALKQCTNITDLALLASVQLTDAHLCNLLPALTRLRRLQLTTERALDDLSCLSAASNLARTLERIRIDHLSSTPAIPPHALMHLRSLRRLQSAEIRITSRRTDTGHTSDTNDTDSQTVYLPMMEDLQIGISGDGDVDLRGMLGRLPRLRGVRLTCEDKSDIDVPPLLHFLAHAPALTNLNLQNTAVTDAHLCSLIPSLPHLRDLTLRDHSLASLRFASASARLAHSLETLSITDRDKAYLLPVNELVHMRSLGALRHLNLELTSVTPAAVGHQEHVDHADCTDIGAAAASLASLTSLHVDSRSMAPDTLELDLSVLGPMPQLRSCQLRLDGNVQVESIALALAHSSQLVDLRIDHPGLTDSHLVALMPRLTHLRELEVASGSHFGGLAFAASTPQLATTLTRLAVRTTDTTPMKSSDMHHLRAFANLTSLSLRFPNSRASLEADLEELTITSPHFRRDCWPRLRYFDDLYCD